MTFDFWDTLVHAPRADEARDARRLRLLGVLADAGLAVEADALGVALTEVRRTFDRHWDANRQYHAADAAEDLVRILGGSLSPEMHDAVAVVFRSSSGGIPALTPNVAATIRLLKDRGLRLAIICDVGFAPSTTLRGYLDHHGVLGLFDHWSFSDEVGVYKPDPKIFAHALDGLGVDDPATAAHVGDLRRTDVAGARAFGMVSVRYAGSNDDVTVPAEGDRAMLGNAGVTEADRTEADVVIADHADLPGALDFLVDSRA